VKYVATQGQRLPEVPGFEPRPSDPQPDAMAIKALVKETFNID